jgi:scavenger receptor class B protein 1
LIINNPFLYSGTLYPENECFCGGECVPSGLFNVSSCRYGTPVFMSFPHFYHADPFYLQQVDGLAPQKEKHQFFMSFEPVRQSILNIFVS